MCRHPDLKRTLAFWLSGSALLVCLSLLVAHDPEHTISPSSPLGLAVDRLVACGRVIHGALAPAGPWAAAGTGLVALLVFCLGFAGRGRAFQGPAYVTFTVSAAVCAHYLVLRSTGVLPWFVLAGAAVLGMFISPGGQDGPRAASGSIPSHPGSLGLLAAALAVGLALRFYLLDRHPYGCAGHAAFHALESERLLAEVRGGGYQGEGVFLGGFHFLFGFGQSILRVLDMVSFRLFGFGFLPQRLMAAMIGVLTIGLLCTTGAVLFGCRCGALAAFLLAVSPWHITWSRYEGCMQIQSLPYLLIAVLLALWATERGAGWRFALAGLWSGLAVLLNAANLLVPLVLLVYMVFAAREDRPGGERRIRRPWVLLFVLGAGLLVLPRLHHTGLELELILDTPLSREAPAGHAGMGERARLFLAQFFQHPDDMHINKSGPILNLFVSACFVSGLGFAAKRLRDRRFFLVVLLVLSGLLPAVLSDGPYPRRFFNMIPAVYLLAAVTIDRCLRAYEVALSRLRPRRCLRTAASLVVPAALAVLAAANAYVYFETVRAPESDRSAIFRAAAEEIRDRYYGKVRVLNVSSALNAPHAQVICHDLERVPGEFAHWFRNVSVQELLAVLLEPGLAAGEPVLILLSPGDPFLAEIRSKLADRYPQVEERAVPEDTLDYGQLAGFYVPVRCSRPGAPLVGSDPLR